MARTHGHSEPRPREYLIIFAALMVLLLVTVAAAFVNLGRVGLPIALGIAVAKAVLIMLYFMHVKFSPTVVKAFAGAGFLWLGVFFVVGFIDFFPRNTPQRREHH